MHSLVGKDCLRQAVILAGGQATRLRPYTDDRPKVLVEVAGRPILEHQAQWLAAGGIEQVVVSSGYLADVLRDYVDQHELPLAVTVLAEDEPLGRGGGFKYAAKALPHQNERWLGLNGDVLTDMSIEKFFHHHINNDAFVSVAIAPFRSPYGIVNLEQDDADVVSEFLEAPILPYWINAGIYIFEDGVAAQFPDKGDHEATTFPKLAEEKRLYAYRINGYWRGIDTAKDIKEAGAELGRTG